MIIIDRESKTSLKTLLKEGKDRLKNGRVITIFPEGTRSDGKQLLPFKPGAKILAEQNNLKVQPVILINTREIVDSIEFRAKPGVVKVIYLEPVQAKKGTSWYEETYEKMKEVLEKELQETQKDNTVKTK
jgi:1-acyl-sn-glycerol-3-phosphate acyltransferase